MSSTEQTIVKHSDLDVLVTERPLVTKMIRINILLTPLMVKPVRGIMALKVVKLAVLTPTDLHFLFERRIP